jgi:tRNA-dihydrouridine synthase
LQLLRRQFAYLEELCGTRSAISAFRKTAHWYLKAMRVPARLRALFQAAANSAEIDAALAVIEQHGPIGGNRTGVLPDLAVPVPSGPVERW